MYSNRSYPTGDDLKYFGENQIKQLKRKAKDQANLAQQKGNITGIREWMLIHLITDSGLRAFEAANIRCGDIKVRNTESKIFVRYGKNGKQRTVLIPAELKAHLKKFFKWKKARGEAVGTDDYLFIGQRGPWTRLAVQKIVKKYLRQLDLYENGKSVHALRHSYAVALYRVEKDLRLVQKQLGHSSITTTQVYADVLEEDGIKQVERIW